MHKQPNCTTIKAFRLLVTAALLAASITALAPPPVAHAATITVNTTDDEYNTDLAECSLREAIQAANTDAAFGGCTAGSGADTITLPAGTYLLTRAGASEDANATGDLDLTSDITLNGAGAATTIIDASQLDRVLQVFSGRTVTLDGVTLRNGKTPNDAGMHCRGGGVENYEGTLTIANSVVSGSATGRNPGGSGCDGGGVENYNGTLTIESSTISGNTTGNAASASYVGGHGGGVASSGGTLTIRNSTISGNATGNSSSANNDGSGGGVYANGGTTTIESSTLSGNAARGHAGGMRNYSTSDAVTLIHVTITDNTADSDADYSGAAHGGGLSWRSGAGAGFIVKNSLIAGNTDNGYSDYDDCLGDSAYYTSQGYNLVGSGTGCPNGGTGDQTTSNPRLDPLQDNGGSTQTHALQYNSPAVDAIANGTNGCGTTYTTDQRGAVRPVDGYCDVGAYESPYVFWLGTGADDYTTRPGNWRGNAVPTADNIPVFMSTNKGATVQSSLTVAGWIVDSSYSGRIQQNNDLTVNGDWTQSGGTFHGYNGTLDIGGAFHYSGGSFTAPLGLMIVSGVFDHTGGTFDPNGGHVLLASTADQTLASTFYDLTINDGLIGYWKLDEGSGTTADDASGYGHAGALHNSPVWNTSTPADMDFHDPYSLQFDRTGSADYVLTDSIPRLDQAQNLSLSAWVRLASTPGGSGLTYMRFITLQNEKAVLRYYDDNGVGKLHFYMRIGGSLHAILVNHTWATNTWYHVAGTYDGSTMRLYLDGVEQDTLDIAGTADSGGWMRLSHSSNTEALDGRLDDVRIYDRALSPTEISDLAAGKHPQTSVATTTLGDALDVNGDLTLNSGTLDVSGSNYAINLGGDLTRNGGVFTAQSGTVTFDGSGIQNLDTDAIPFYDLTVNSGSTLVDLADFSVDGTLTNDGALQQTQEVNGSNTAFLNVKDSGGSQDKYFGLEINPGTSNMASTTVTIHGNQTCSDAPSLGKDPIQRCFYIEPTTPLTATVKLYYLTSELNGNTASTLSIYHEKNGLWYLEGGTYTRESDGDTYDWVQVTGVDEYSPFTAGNHEDATLLELASFTATAQDGYVLVEWETASEIDNEGFNLWRSETRDGPYVQLNAALIPAQGGPTFGASYTYDDADVTDDVTYRYKLEDVNLYGVSTFHGPVVMAGRAYRLYLPLILKGG